MTVPSSFVADGWWRARFASEPIVRAEVTKEFSERLHAAEQPDAERLRIEIEREIDRRLDRIAPANALY